MLCEVLQDYIIIKVVLARQSFFCFFQALDIRREALGDKDGGTITSMTDLALTHKAQGRYSEAEPLEIQALDYRREILGDKQPDTAQSMHDLA